MGIKKVIASLLCLATVAGCAGCENGFLTKKKAITGIGETLEKYAEALRDMDDDDLLVLTDWDDDDNDYREISAILRPDTQNESVVRFYKAVASTISVDYESDDIDVKDGKASVKVKYVSVDWNDAYELYLETGDAKQAVKKTKDTVSVKGKISFVLDGDEWKISKITNLEEVFSFIGMFRNTIPEPTPTEPVPIPTPIETIETDPTFIEPSGTAFPDSYGRARNAYIDILEQNRDAIRAVEDGYYIDPVGIYDIDGNGIPELYFISDAGNNYSAVLHVYEYGEYMGEAREVITVPNILSQGQASGDYLIYVTDNELVVTYTYGESYFFHVESEIYSIKESGDATYKWDMVARYAREIFTDYDPETDTETETRNYYLHDYTISESTYYTGMNDIVSRTTMVLGKKFYFSSEDPEYGLLSKPSSTLFSYGTAIEYLKSLG